MKLVSDFLAEVDLRWAPLRPGRQALRIIGCGALMLQTDYERGTKDSDVLHAADLADDVRDRLLELAGKDSTLHRRHRIYIDIVGGGIPFLAQRPVWHALDEINARLRHFELYVLDVVDVVVSKLKRFHANDQADVAAMVERGLVTHDTLVRRFEAAKDVWQDGAFADDLPRYIDNLHRVERDMLFVDESTIDLPDWIDR